MNNALYPMIYKRKSFHLFRDTGDEKISSEELNDIVEKFYQLKPLVKDIKVQIKIEKNVLTCHRGQEYCLLFYSEKKDNYLQNIGYLGEQLDLYLVSKNIGTLWFGIGKASQKVDGLDYVIMMAIKKIDREDKFRKDMFKSKRKNIEEIWLGNKYLDVANIVRFAPSACNLQPWYVKEEENTIEVYRYRNINKRGIMPKNRVIYYNQIDMGIFLCFMELCLNNQKIKYERELYVESDHELEKNLVAKYHCEEIK